MDGNLHLQKHKTSDLNIRPASDNMLRHSSYYTQGEINKAFQCPGRFKREDQFFLSPRQESFISASPDPASIYLQEEDSNERNGEGDHHFGVFLCW